MHEEERAKTGRAGFRVSVDRSVCQTHGQCAFFAPEVFVLTEDGELEYDAFPVESLRESVEEAVQGCPTQAITLTD
jgi:ferredoxin